MNYIMQLPMRILGHRLVLSTLVFRVESAQSILAGSTFVTIRINEMKEMLGILADVGITNDREVLYSR